MTGKIGEMNMMNMSLHQHDQHPHHRYLRCKMLQQSITSRPLLYPGLIGRRHLIAHSTLGCSGEEVLKEGMMGLYHLEVLGLLRGVQRWVQVRWRDIGAGVGVVVQCLLQEWIMGIQVGVEGEDYLVEGLLKDLEG